MAAISSANRTRYNRQVTDRPVRPPRAESREVVELKAIVDEEARKRNNLDLMVRALAADIDALVEWLKQPRSTGRSIGHSHPITIIPPDNKTWD